MVRILPEPTRCTSRIRDFSAMSPKYNRRNWLAKFHPQQEQFSRRSSLRLSQTLESWMNVRNQFLLRDHFAAQTGQLAAFSGTEGGTEFGLMFRRHGE